MNNTNLSVGTILEYIIVISVLAAAQPALSDELMSDKKGLLVDGLTPVIVLDLEMLGDTSVEHLKKNDAALMEKFSEVFRQQLKQNSVFDVIDDEDSMALIQRQGQQQFLHRCNGCELDLAKQLGAKQVIVPWIFRMSILIQSLVIEIRDVETGRLILKRPYNFRGNTDRAWEKTLLYAIQDLKETIRGSISGS